MFGRCRGGIVVRAIDCFDGHKFETSSRQKVFHHRITLIVIPEREREREKSLVVCRTKRLTTQLFIKTVSK